MAQPSNDPKPVARVLARGVVTLSKTSDSARIDAQILLEYAIGRDREWTIAHPDAAVSAEDALRYTILCERRARGTPIAYIVGSAWFYGREFRVDDHVLIPRPETEHLVDEAVEHLRGLAAAGRERVDALDVGTGSGAIACSIAAEVPQSHVDATDASSAALEIAERNARSLHVAARCALHLGDLARPVAGRTYDAVVANLPYVPTADVPRLPDPAAFEPLEALDGGADGLDCYRRFLPSAPALLRDGAVLLLEAAPPVMGALKKVTVEHFPHGRIDVRDDYGGRARYLRVRV